MNDSAIEAEIDDLKGRLSELKGRMDEVWEKEHPKIELVRTYAEMMHDISTRLSQLEHLKTYE